MALRFVATLACATAMRVDVRRIPSRQSSTGRIVHIMMTASDKSSSERLFAEVGRELDLLNQFAGWNQDEWALEDEVDEHLRRRTTSEVWTKDERAMVDKWARLAGCADAEVFLQKHLTKYASDDPIRMRAHLLALCKRAPIQNLLNLPEPTRRELSRAGERLDEIIARRPSVDPMKGFAPNSEIDAEHDRSRGEALDLRRQMKQKGGKFTSFDGLPFGSALGNNRRVQKSPFGPVSSSACYEELGPVRLTNLVGLHQHLGHAMPRTKILLTVVKPAIVSPSSVVTTIVKDESGQHVRLQIFGNTSAWAREGARDTLPINGRLVLRNPFLKLQADGWLGLRVDQPFDLERLDLPPLRGQILVVGDGDFSFSAALARLNADRGSARITATSLDSEDYVTSTYDKARRNLDMLDADDSVVVMHGVDATNLNMVCVRHPHGQLTWDSIVWNFPYPAQNVASPKQGSMLLADFLSQVSARLDSPNGRVYVTLASAQGGTTREAAAYDRAWDIDKLSSEAGLELIEVLPFDPSDFPGYEPRRAYRDGSFPFEGARTHILRVSRESAVGEAPSERSVMSRLSSFFIDKLAWGGRGHRHTVVSKTIESLDADVYRSATARSLRDAAFEFQRVDELLADLPADGPFYSARFASYCLTVTGHLERVYSTRHGELVAHWDAPGGNINSTGGRKLLTALLCARMTTLVHLDGTEPPLTRAEIAAVSDACTDGRQFSRVLSDAIFVSGRSCDVQLGTQLASAILAVVNLERSLQELDVARHLLDAACRVLNDPRLYMARALLNAHLNSLDPADISERLQAAILEDCNAVLEQVPNDPEALYTGAYALRSSRKTFAAAVMAYDKYIDLVEPSDRQLPSAYYHAGLMHIMSACVTMPAVSENSSPLDGPIGEAHETARRYYDAGLRAEAARLTFFGPETTDSKRLLGVLTMAKRKAGSRPRRSVTSGKAKQVRKTKPLPADFESEVATLLSASSNGEILVGEFGSLYTRTFGKRLRIPGMRLKAALQQVAALGSCRLEGSGTTLRIITDSSAPSSAPSPSPSPSPATRAVPAADSVDFSAVAALLKETPEIYAGNLKKLYQRKFGRQVPLQRGQKLKAWLQADSGVCTLQDRGSSLWLVARNDNDGLAPQVRVLLDKRKELALASFKQAYQQQFGKPVPLQPGQKLRSALQIVADAGACALEDRGDPPNTWVVRKSRAKPRQAR